MFSTRQIVQNKNAGFACSKRVNSRFRWTLSSNDIISCSNSAFPWLSNSKRPSLMLSLWWNCVSQLLPSMWSVLLEYLCHSYVFMDYGVFLRCLFLFFFRCFCCCYLFSLWSSFLARILSLAVKMQQLRQPLLNWL